MLHCVYIGCCIKAPHFARVCSYLLRGKGLEETSPSSIMAAAATVIVLVLVFVNFASARPYPPSWTQQCMYTYLAIYYNACILLL